METLSIAAESVKSLFVRGMRPPLDGGELLELTQGTAFVVKHNECWFMVTNMHVVTGRDPVSGKPIGTAAAMPTTLAVWHNSGAGLGNWVQVNYELYDEHGRAQWLEHPHSTEWDIVAIQIAPKPEVVYYPYEFTEPGQRMVISPGSDLSIIGFPFGTASDGRFAIWSRATLASDSGLNYLNRPTFLVDSRSREGQSGSPVILKTNMAHYESGEIAMLTGPQAQLLGVYSGRISKESDIGIVWKSQALIQLLDARRRSVRLLDG